MRIPGRGQALVALLIVLGMVGGLGYSLASSEQQARARQESDFGRRAALAARLTAGAVASGGSNAARLQFSGDEENLRAAMRAWESSGGTDEMAGILDSSGRVLVSWPLGTDSAFAHSYPHELFMSAVHGSHAVIGDLVLYGKQHTPLVWVVTSFKTPYGRRVLASLSQAAQLATFAAPYLRSAPGVQGARAYLIDGHGLVIASSSNNSQGTPLVDGGLTSAVLTGRSSGALGSTDWTAARVGGDTNWRVVFSVRRATLLAAVQGSNEVSWLLFGAFVLAVLALAGLATTAIRGSAQLAGARERERAAHQLAHERLHDALTGLPNRALFLDRAETALARAQRGESSAAVMFSDVDHFKRINDSLGHAAGDELLRMLARRLRDAVRPQDTVSRFGGDEFLVLCDDLRDENDALRIAARVRSALDEPFELSGRSVPLTCCVGIAVHSPTAERIDAATLVRDADAAMYSAKAQGTGRLELFDAALHAEALRRLDSELALRAAIEHDELFVHYQPIVELPGGQLQGVEALARWNRRGEGAVPPTSFIALAEECGLIDELGRKVLETAMSEVREWCNAGLLPESFVLSVNVSPRQLANPGFPHTVAELLKSWPLEPSTLCLEITESAVASDPVITELALSRLAELGVKLALDDFGVGLSSLKQLVRSLPVDVIKLDRSFVADMASSRECSVVAAVAPMARSLGMAAIAEGVERADQAKQLASLGYTLAQGFHFGRPMQAEAIRRTLLHEDLAAA